jgi:gliding motility-associated-like protein
LSVSLNKNDKHYYPKNMIRSILFLIGLFIFTNAYATHIRGGEITAKRISNNALTYEFTINLYCDMRGGAQACNAADQVLYFCLGDGTVVKAPRISNKDVGNSTSHSLYRYTYTYQAPGVYKISAMQENRNDNVINMNNSVQTNFYISTTLVINASLGQNTTPVLLNPPVDFTAVTGQKWTHNPAAYDADGDSLAYRMYIPQQGTGVSFCGGIPVNGYKDPTAIGTCNPNNLAINATTGDVVWNAPCVAGQYNIAFIIEEWRRAPDGTFVKIGEVIRDMQIIVEASDNAPPVIEVPTSICVEAGKLVNFTIKATDTPSPKNNRVDLLTFSTYSGVYQQTSGSQYIVPDYAIFQQAGVALSSPATGLFRWQTNCQHIRKAPYDVLFKVQDNPGSVLPPLIDSKTVKITVVAPRPTQLKATPVGSKAIRLSWSAYNCATASSTAQFVIYRKEGCAATAVDICTPIVPAGYVEVGRVAINTLTFLDDNAGKGLTRGKTYSYRIAVDFGSGNSGQSAVSDEVCQTVVLPPMSLITNVTVDKTDAMTGEITVKWTRPTGLDTASFKRPYQYRLSRAIGLNGTAFATIATINTLLNTKPDTVFVDKNLNTKDNAYRYRLSLFYTENNALTLLDSTDAASSVRLTTAVGVKSIDLSWQANVPWSNQNQTHRVYRQLKGQPDKYNIIAEVPVGSSNLFRYTDNGTDAYAADGIVNVKMSPDSQYCYRVETVGSYNDAKVRPVLLYNLSQLMCETPKDTTRPCPPILKLDDFTCDIFNASTPCSQTSFKNILTWTNSAKNAQGQECDVNIVKYTVYYTRREKDAYGKLSDIIGTLPAQTYTHQPLSQMAGCYYVTATNKNGLESGRSNVVCRDNCVNFKLPNVITPNGDGKNDALQPMECPRFIESIVFVVYNRWGTKVFEGTDPAINWRGTDSNGSELPAGQYFYEATVKFNRLKVEDEITTVKGWVSVLR